MIAAVGCAGSSADDTAAGGGQAISAGAPAAAATAAPQDPAVGNPARVAFMSAVHAKFDPMLHGQKVLYLVSFLKTEGGFTFMDAQLQPEPGPNVDWSNTDFAQDIDFLDLNTDQHGVQHVHFSAIAKKTGATYSGVDLVVAPTDVSFAGEDNPAVPKDIFPFPISE
jgi:hypothetical protein